MQPTPEERAAARSRANRRLRKMTIGTTVLGVAATGFLSGAAAFGTVTATDDGSTALVAEAGDAGSASATATATPAATTSSTAAGSSATSTSTSTGVTATSGAAHATTGGS
jgi:hypothetical protein